VNTKLQIPDSLKNHVEKKWSSGNNPMRYFHGVWYVAQLILLLVVVVTVLSQVAPVYQPIPGRDQGVYLYIGRQILEGKIPYRDVWDHKGPVIYYINALGLFIAKSVWGIWLLEVVSLFTAALFGYLALRLIFDKATALSCSVLWLVATMPILISGNEVEEYSLPLQFASVYLYLRSEKEAQSYWSE
jgi:hypothetical protein